MAIEQARPLKTGRKRSWWRRVLVIALLLVAMGPLFAWLGARLLIVKADMPSADAIVVLSGSATYVERAAWAAMLYRQGRAPVVILTNDGLIGGWDHVADRNPHFYELAAKELQRQGVPADKIQIALESAAGTYQESLVLREYATTHKIKRLLVVTSAYHTRRALWSMRHACEGSGIEVGIVSPPPGWQTPTGFTWWYHRWGWKVVAGEYVKMVYYWTQY
jgi:uncharacterized SAM-binding protein YcdF (DUF218 family)